MRVFKRPSSNVEKKRKQTSSTTTNMVGRRGDLSSPVLLCNESYLEKKNKKQKR